MLNGKKIVALCTARLAENATHEFVAELNKKLQEIDCGMIIGNLCSDEEWLKDFMSLDTAVFDLFDYDIVDLVVMMDEKIKNKDVVNKVVADATSHGIPVISVDSKSDGCINVTFDFEAGFEEVVRHVVEDHQITDVHMMAGFPDNQFSNDRIEVLKKVLKEHDVEFTDDMLSYGMFWSEPTREAMAELLKRDHIPRAIICANDVMAINVCVMLQEHGYHVPEDVVVTGFDGIDEIFYTEPQITSSMCDYKKVGAYVSDMITSYFAGQTLEHMHYIKPSFIQGCSCGCNSSERKTRSVSSLNVGFYRYQDSERALAFVAEQIQMSHQIEQIVEKFDLDLMDNMACVICKSCLDPSVGIEDGEVVTEFDDEFVVVCRSSLDSRVPYEVSRKDLYSIFEDKMNQGIPIVLNGLGSMNRVLGFACFYYECDDILSYGKIPSIINALSNGIRGYMNVQRQIYLRDQMEKLYACDSLTGLYNRMGFNRLYDKLIEKVKKSGEMVTVILSDLDGLKKINDKHGHVIGDKAIVAIAHALKESCPKDALCVRLGGDEMLAVIVGECDGQKLCRDINQWLDHYNETAGLPCEVSTSLGLYMTSDPKMLEFDRLIIESDRAMYQQKQAHHMSLH